MRATALDMLQIAGDPILDIDVESRGAMWITQPMCQLLMPQRPSAAILIVDILMDLGISGPAAGVRCPVSGGFSALGRLKSKTERLVTARFLNICGEPENPAR